MLDRIKAAVAALVYGPASLRAGYDAAKTSPENKRHWANATDQPAVHEHTPTVRAKLRSRGRYEWMNNCYCSGMVSTYTTDTIGYTLPKLQLQTPDTQFNALVEDAWDTWARSPYVNLSAKLRIVDEGKHVEGENFIGLIPDIDVEYATGVGLGIINVGSSRVTDPSHYTNTLTGNIYNDDGVLVDVNTGRAVGYKVVDPADEIRYGGGTGFMNEVKPVSARYLLHWHTPRRAGQMRGVCEYAAALPLYAQLRRYDLATLTAAETAAMLAGIMKTTLPVVEPAKVQDWTKTELERGTLLSLPEGWEAMQFKPEQPISAYEMFVNCVLRQIGRVLDMPFGVVSGDSSRYNYSSARLDYTGYDERLKYDREQLCIRILTPIFYEWFLEWVLNNTKYLNALGRSRTVRHTWQFTRRPSIDPQKDANTASELITNGTSNLAIESAKLGQNWVDVLEQRAKEMQKMKALGLLPPEQPTSGDGLKPDA